MRPTVLLVEDHELLSTSVAMALRAEGVEVESTNPDNDHELLAKVRAVDPTVMFDLDLGGSPAGARTWSPTWSAPAPASSS